MTRYGLDYSDARPDPKELKVAGYSFVIRYIAEVGATKAVTTDEIKALHDEEIDVAFVYEEWENSALTPSNGTSQATRAHQLMQELGIPNDVGIYLTVDSRDVAPAQVEGFFSNAVATNVRDIGAYGNRGIIEASPGWGVIWRWQVETWGGLSPMAHIAQLPNSVSLFVDTDVDGAYVDNFGQWRATATQPIIGDDSMKVRYIWGPDSLHETDWVFDGPSRIYATGMTADVLRACDGNGFLQLGRVGDDTHGWFGHIASSW